MAGVNQKPWGFIIFISVILLIAMASYWLAPMAVGPINLAVETVLSLLGLVFVVTLFVERAQEVVLTNWRAMGSEALDLKARALERQIERLKRSNAEHVPEALFSELEQVRLEKLQYRARTRVFALRLGVVMGVAVSMAGIRTLGVFVPVHTVLGFEMIQQMIFHSVDVLITGGVIAGGSDGIHKMAELYRVFVETKAREEKRKLSPLNE